MSFLKATAITGFRFGMISSTDGSDITSGTPIGYYSIDSSPQAAIAAIPVYDNNGEFKVDLTAAELNGDIVGLTFKLAGAITVHFTIKTETKLVSQLNDFNPSVDAVATVTTVTNQPPAPDNAAIAAILADTSTTIPAQITGLNNIAATDIVTGGAIATTAGAVDIVTTNADMRGTDGANTVAPDNTSIASILADTNELQLDWTATGRLDTILGSRMAEASIATTAGAVDTVTNVTNQITGYATSVAQSAIDTKVNTLLTDVGTAGAGLTNIAGMSLAMKAEVRAEAEAALVSHDAPTNTQLNARTPTPAQLEYIVSNSSLGVPVTFTSGTTTTAILALVDSVAPSTSNSHYNGRLLVFTDSTLKDLATDITGYSAATKEVTFTETTLPVGVSSTARLV